VSHISGLDITITPKSPDSLRRSNPEKSQVPASAIKHIVASSNTTSLAARISNTISSDNTGFHALKTRGQVLLPVLLPPAHPGGALRLGHCRQAYCEVRYSNTCRNMVRHGKI